MASPAYSTVHGNEHCLPYLPGGSEFETPAMKERNAYLAAIDPNYFLVWFDRDRYAKEHGIDPAKVYPPVSCWQIWHVIVDHGVMVLERGGRPAARCCGPYVLITRDGDKVKHDFPLEITSRIQEFLAEIHRDPESSRARLKKIHADAEELRKSKALDEGAARHREEVSNAKNRVSPGLLATVEADLEGGPDTPKKRRYGKKESGE